MCAFEVGAGAEGAAGAGYDADAQGGLAVQPGEDFAQLGVAGHVDAVELFGPVERDEQDVGGRVGEEAVLRWRRLAAEGRRRHCRGQLVRVAREEGFQVEGSGKTEAESCGKYMA